MPTYLVRKHGQDIAGTIHETAEDAPLVEDGALYTALHRLEERGYSLRA
jgi:DNA-binding PadR family transcriptional regulator